MGIVRLSTLSDVCPGLYVQKKRLIASLVLGVQVVQDLAIYLGSGIIRRPQRKTTANGDDPDSLDRCPVYRALVEQNVQFDAISTRTAHDIKPQRHNTTKRLKANMI